MEISKLSIADPSWWETTSDQVVDSSLFLHYNDVIMSAMASQITSPMIVYSTVYSGADQRKHQSSTSLAFVRGKYRWPVNSPHKGSVTWKMFPFDDVIMQRDSDVEKVCMPWRFMLCDSQINSTGNNVWSMISDPEKYSTLKIKWYYMDANKKII